MFQAQGSNSNTIQGSDNLLIKNNLKIDYGTFPYREMILTTKPQGNRGRTELLQS
jgi:hypothetical protein